MIVKVKRIGNVSKGIIIPYELCEYMDLHYGDFVDISKLKKMKGGTNENDK